MNAYDLADYLEKQYIHSQGVADAISMLREQADRIAELEEENKVLRLAMDDAFMGCECLVSFSKAKVQESEYLKNVMKAAQAGEQG